MTNAKRQSTSSFIIRMIAVLTVVGLSFDRCDVALAQTRSMGSALRELYSKPTDQWPAPNVDANVQWNELGPIPNVEHPATNPMDSVKAALGASLFFDPRLSGSRQIACASCHDPELGWADGRTTGFGHNRIRLPRHSPTIRNAGLHRQLFWDGRVDSLEQQVIDVVNSPDEMHSSAEHVADLIREQYDYRGGIFSIYRKKLQLTAVPDVASLSDEQILQCVSEVIACFERTIVGGQSRWDAFLLGRRDALTDQELLGLDLFRQDGRCMNCHHGPLMTDGKFHNLGLARFDRGQTDPGRYAVTEDLDDIGKFRTPSLRDVSRTGPYMHNGLLDLSTALRFYNRGMFQPPAVVIDGQSVSPQKSSHLRPLGMTTSELSALESFLRALEEPWSRVETPSFPDFERSEE